MKTLKNGTQVTTCIHSNSTVGKALNKQSKTENYFEKLCNENWIIQIFEEKNKKKSNNKSIHILTITTVFFPSKNQTTYLWKQ